MLDLHVHVWPHQPGTPTPTFDLLAQYCDAAGALGIEQIAITEHSHRFTRVAAEVLPHWSRPQHGEVAEATEHVLRVEGGADLDAYVAALQRAQDRGLPILIGMEVDYLPEATTAMAEVMADYPFDVLLGSVHWLDEWLFDAYDTPGFARRWEERDTDEVYAQYVDSVIELANSGMVDVLAHLDVIKVAGHVPKDPGKHEDRLVEALAEADVVVEFSSAGLRKPAVATYPAPDLLERLINAGVGVTTASDAHMVEQIGASFDVLEAALDSAGVENLTTFARRLPRQVPRRRFRSS